MMNSRWREILIRVAGMELANWNEYCAKNCIKRVDLVRNAVRLYIANPDIVNGVLRIADNDVDIGPILKGIGNLSKKLEAIEKRLDAFSAETDFVQPLARRRIAEGVLKAKQRTKDGVTTVDSLTEQLKQSDPSLVPFLFSANANGSISLLHEVLAELHQKGELSWDFKEIIRFRVGNDEERPFLSTPEICCC